MSYTKGNKDFKENAQLIATAPELLEICKQLIYNIELYDDVQNSDIKIMKEAIQKAEGR